MVRRQVAARAALVSSPHARGDGPMHCPKSCVFGQRHHLEPRDAKSGTCAVAGNSVLGQAQAVSTTLGVCETVSHQMTESQAERAKRQWIEKINQQSHGLLTEVLYQIHL